MIFKFFLLAVFLGLGFSSPSFGGIFLFCAFLCVGSIVTTLQKRESKDCSTKLHQRKRHPIKTQTNNKAQINLMLVINTSMAVLLFISVALAQYFGFNEDTSIIAVRQCFLIGTLIMLLYTFTLVFDDMRLGSGQKDVHIPFDKEDGSTPGTTSPQFEHTDMDYEP